MVLHRASANQPNNIINSIVQIFGMVKRGLSGGTVYTHQTPQTRALPNSEFLPWESGRFSIYFSARAGSVPRLRRGTVLASDDQ
jgi:hypothetical protein